MLSPDFLSSHYCENEMVHALDRHEKREVTVIPIIARPCIWQINPNLKRIEAAIKSQIISTADHPDELYVKIANNVIEVAKRKRQELELARLQAKEDDFWQTITKKGEIDTFRKYLNIYPNGKYIQEAEKSIRKIEEQEQEKRLAALQRQEKIFWQQCQEENTITVYHKYLSKYPNGQYDRLAEQAIRKIELIAEEKRLALLKQQESTFWEQCQKEHTIASYQNYLHQYPNGNHAAQAEKAIRNIEERQQEERLVQLQQRQTI